MPRSILAPVLLAMAACGGGTDDHAVASVALPQVDRSPLGVVSAAQPLAARAGAEMLELGGNAVDAAVAAAFTLAVVEPSMSGLGGRTQILIRLPDGTHVGIDGTTQAPATYDPDTAADADYGYGVIGVPGTPAALFKAHAEYGTLPRSTLLAEAIRLAEDGYEVLPREAGRRSAVQDQLAEFEGSRAAFLNRDGTPHAAGELFRQPDLARTLRVLEEGGADAFYRGELAEAVAADIQANGGHVTLASLAAYEAVDSRIVTGDYRGHEIVGLWLPSYGAISIEILNLLESVDASTLSEEAWAHALTEAIRVGYLDRAAQEDWDDALRLTSEAWADERDDLMRLEAGVALRPEGGDGVAGARTPPTFLAPTRRSGPVAEERQPDARPGEWEAPGHTTHLTASDAEGMVVSLTQSLGPNMGSRVASPGLGFLYAATLGGYLGRVEPEERARSHISPLLVERDGVPVLGLGAAGGSRIPTAIVAVVSRVLDRGMTLEEALAAPRVVPGVGPARTSGNVDRPLEAELERVSGLGFDSSAAAFFVERGYAVETVDRAGAFGRVHAVRWHPDEGVWEGGADPDWEGAVAIPRGDIR